MLHLVTGVREAEVPTAVFKTAAIEIDLYATPPDSEKGPSGYTPVGPFPRDMMSNMATKKTPEPQTDQTEPPPSRPPPPPTWAEIRRMPSDERQTLFGEQDDPGAGDPEKYARLMGIPPARTPSPPSS